MSSGFNYLMVIHLLLILISGLPLIDNFPWKSTILNLWLSDSATVMNEELAKNEFWL